MNNHLRLLLAAAATASIAACSASGPPPLTAFQRNVGPGSTVTGIPSNSMGPPGSGNTQVPGVSTAGPTLR